jgi:hypothetical protein
MLKANPERPQIKPYDLPADVLKIPIMCNPGTKEGVTEKKGRFARVWPSNETFFTKVRGAGGLVGVSIDPLSSHECGNSRYMAIPWLDTCLSARLPKTSGKKLRPMPAKNAWLAHLLGKKAQPKLKFQGNPLKAVWLPNAKIARKWMEFVEDTKITDPTPPPPPTDIKINGNQLSWKAEADLESGISHFLIKRNGKVIGQVPEDPSNKFGRSLFQGLQYSDTPVIPLRKMVYTEQSGKIGKVNEYRIISVNTVGLKSE